MAIHILFYLALLRRDLPNFAEAFGFIAKIEFFRTVVLASSDANRRTADQTATMRLGLRARMAHEKASR